VTDDSIVVVTDDAEDATPDDAMGAGPSDTAAGPDDRPAPDHWAARVRSFVDEATRLAKEDLADKEVTFDETVKRAEEVIRKQPLAAVGVAAGAGLLAGMIIKRRG
jgi:hypothetical protein